ncbi:MAG: hypothetical protein R2762_26520 [Bryobacteraceae bacterium]
MLVQLIAELRLDIAAANSAAGNKPETPAGNCSAMKRGINRSATDTC